MKLAHFVGVVGAMLGLMLMMGNAEAATCPKGTSGQSCAQAKKQAAGARKGRRLGARSAAGSSTRIRAANELSGLEFGRRKGSGGSPAALIRSMAPNYGVPAWFAVRIAMVESSLRPRVRGAAGEYGLFQLKCTTARGLGFRGSCGQLLDTRTNIKYGLIHLQKAIRSSRGNLRLAASKHNGGLGRRTLVPKYVRRVFG